MRQVRELELALGPVAQLLLCHFDLGKLDTELTLLQIREIAHRLRTSLFLGKWWRRRRAAGQRRLGGRGTLEHRERMPKEGEMAQCRSQFDRRRSRIGGKEAEL